MNVIFMLVVDNIFRYAFRLFYIYFGKIFLDTHTSSNRVINIYSTLA